jgi:hypothetical protein
VVAIYRKLFNPFFLKSIANNLMLEIYDYDRSLSINSHQSDVRTSAPSVFSASLPDLKDNVGARSLGLVLDKVKLASEKCHMTFLSGINFVIFWVPR